MEPTLKTQMQLEAHEKECAMFRQLVHSKLDGLEKRMWRMEAVLVAIAVAVLVEAFGIV